MDPDPYYQSGPAQWVARTTTAFTGLQIITDEQLPQHLAARIDHSARIVYVTPGLAFDDYHWAVCRAVVRDMWGSDYAPEFAPADRHLHLVPSQRATTPIPAADLVCKECGRWLPTGQTNLS